MDEKTLREILSKENPAFKQILEQHQKCDEELEKLKGKKILSGEEEQKIRDMKKKKLRLKDKMYALMSAYRDSLR
jgi:uncharacterized protein YdcH (DUF465 family)